MVIEKSKGRRRYFVCGVCALAYPDIDTAQRCEAWCKKHPGTCDPDIVKRAVVIE